MRSRDSDGSRESRDNGTNAANRKYFVEYRMQKPIDTSIAEGKEENEGVRGERVRKAKGCAVRSKGGGCRGKRELTDLVYPLPEVGNEFV